MPPLLARVVLAAAGRLHRTADRLTAFAHDHTNATRLPGNKATISAGAANVVGITYNLTLTPDPHEVGEAVRRALHAASYARRR